ncbi:roadblock/LC7 domain-containing protein [Streptomyces sp. NPDC052043]|uniref:roadblock/LC7 domain-containing protein n=1 Tax=Streptomyces sp. NPDC052043 TaxID=3365684 RepID=UPI0037D46124
MAAEPEILDELRRLRARVPQLTGALAASVDGLVLAHDTPGVEPESVAALTATALGVAVRMADVTGQGELRELLVRGVHGYVATYAAGGTAVLTLLAEDRVNVGRLHLEGRRAGARIGELVDAEPAPAPGRTPAKAVKPATRAGTARTRTARAPRTTATDARTTTES